jgi:phosphatidylserine/phosphatidylglycerophosphate/cardiolipin synthase-like enzyme
MKFSFKTVISLAIVALFFGFAIGAMFYGEIYGPVNFQQPANTAVPVSGDTVSTYFCPADNCSQHLISEINSAQSRLHIAVYSFTLDSIADAVIAAKNRGLEVKIVVDKQQASVEGAEFDRLKSSGIDIHLDGNPSLMHDKIAVIDNGTVATGSFNWTANADTRNNENLVIIKSSELNSKFESEFQKIYAEAE